MSVDVPKTKKRLKFRKMKKKRDEGDDQVYCVNIVPGSSHNWKRIFGKKKLYEQPSVSSSSSESGSAFFRNGWVANLDVGTSAAAEATTAETRVEPTIIHEIELKPSVNKAALPRSGSDINLGVKCLVAFQSASCRYPSPYDCDFDDVLNQG